MIHLVLGDVGSGKTTLCARVLEELECKGFSCGGVLCPSVFRNGRKVGSVIVDVASKEERDFSFHKSTGRQGSTEFCEWVFTQEGIEFGIYALRRGLSSDVLFVDEIGPMELSGMGFAGVLPELFRRDGSVVAAMKRHIKDRFHTAYPDVKTREYDVACGEEAMKSILAGIHDGI